ncbi:MAG: N-6 DNA methylase [Nanoarchaeota archaeon]|nr:N-6 DNA methylase [Nanoarchaeota archaeon]
MVTKEEAKKRVEKLVSSFKENYEYYKKLSEADVETKLVEELFIHILGWTKNDFKKQAPARRGEKRGTVDYAFHIEDKTVFFLEVKRVGIPLDKEADKQVISYALSKGIPFAVSTNFEQLKIFCVEQEKAIRNVFRVFDGPDKYIDDFEDLWLLSKEEFDSEKILKKAETEGRLKKRISIDKPLLEDLMRIRSMIASDIEKNYPDIYQINEKDEIVQRILDRLIFIRRCEDIGINPKNITLQEIKHLPDNKAYPKLKEIFKKYNEIYDGGLFAIERDNDCDKININGSIIKKLTYGLYESKNKEYIYNFDWIDADVLGQVYEQYLGKILAQTKSGKAKLKEGQAHRKEQGIYYTPTYIVDYIVKNTVGELLKEKKIKAKNMKILDPACGSGSFLIKAFDYMYKDRSKDKESKQHKLDEQGSYSIKTEILKKNIYGVDLDVMAVEIAKLNLLLKAAEKERKLPPEADMHIKHGDSLIDDKKIVGTNAFKWEGDFEEKSFDIVIGNPPYVDLKQMDPKIVAYLFKKYLTVENRMNLYSTFVEKSLFLLKDGGYFGFIIPNSILYNESYSKIRELLLNEVSLKKIIRLPDNIFGKVKVETIILIYQKKEARKKDKCEVFIYPRDASIDSIKKENCPHIEHFTQNIWKTENKINISLTPLIEKLLKKIEKNTTPLIELCDFSLGLTPYDKYKGHTQKQIRERVFHSKTKKDKTFKPLLSGKNIVRYGVFWDREEYISYGSWLGAPRQPQFFKEPRILVRQIISGSPARIYAAYTNKEFYNAQIGFNIIVKNKKIILIKYILAILDSKLMNHYHKERYLDPSKHLFQKILIANAKKFPIKVISLNEQKHIINFVDTLIDLKETLKEMGDKKTSQSAKIEEEIKRIDEKIDELVYKIYGITEKEKKIIEESLK